jgi:organic hydroperoxide reductase OsmC/OhrA
MVKMHPYPHKYVASAAAQNAGLFGVTSPQLPSLDTAPPPEFDGPGGTWSPETLLCASLVGCFILSFRPIARLARFDWLRLDCRVEGLLDRVERVSQFTRFTTFARLIVPAGTDVAKARQLLERAEHTCLISNSLRSIRALEAEVIVTDR